MSRSESAARAASARWETLRHQATCAVCEASFHTAHPAAKYCSNKCRNRARYEQRVASGKEVDRLARAKARYASDPEYRAAVRERQTQRNRAAGVRPMVDPTPRTCPECGASFTGAYTKRYCRVTILPNGGAWIYCPRCKGTMHIRWQADEWFERHCLTCDVHLTMNEEELRWVTSETASTAA